MRTKIIILLFVVFLVPLFTLGVYIFTTTPRAIEEKDRAFHSFHTESMRREIETPLQERVEDLFFLSNSHTIYSFLNPEDEREKSNWFFHMKMEFLDLSQVRRFYYQLRYIDEKGQEMVRIDSDRKNLWIVPEEKLQYKGDRYYFSETMKLSQGELFISPLDLNREGSPPEIEVPFNPVVRYAMPVFDKKGKRRGIVITNLYASLFLKVLEEMEWLGRNFLVDREGYYLRHPDRRKEWGGPRDLNTGERLHKDYPEATVRKILSGDSGIEEYEEQIIFFSPVFYGPGEKDFWVLMHLHHKAEILAAVVNIKRMFYGVILVSLVLVTGLGLIFSRRITGPLKTLEKKVHDITEGKFGSELQLKTGDEIEELANGFEVMRQRLKERVTGLERRYQKIIEMFLDTVVASDESGRIVFWNTVAERMFGYTKEEALGMSLEKLMPEKYREKHRKGLKRFLETRKPVLIGKTVEVEGLRKDGTRFPNEINLSGEKIEGKWLLTGVIRDITERKAAEEKIEHHLKQLAALHSIDMAISGSLDLNVTLDVILEQAVNQLRIDAAAILLYKPHLQVLEYAAGRGFNTQALQYTRLKIGESYAGKAALERRIVHISNLREKSEGFKRSKHLEEEGFISYYGVPLIAKGDVKGVLEVFNRTEIKPDKEWLDFLEALAGQAAIAIDNSTLFDNLQRSNLDLTMAYDETIEGWSKALDLRDKETEGHSQRVTELTLRIANTIGISEAEQAHMRRGALLHDIGKMGIPDSILLKPGPLDDEEWEIMRKHPVFGHELLLPIDFLRPSLDIPYCHHERWDGTGYPQGLKGEQIPLAARIFAVVDIYDALSSERPYRPAWSKEKVLEYIRSLAGNHLDPKVVEVFLKMEKETST